MAKISLKFTQDQITLISAFRPTDVLDDGVSAGINPNDIYGGANLLWDMAFILDKTDHIINGTESDPDGPKFDEETYKYLKDTDEFLMKNLMNIEEILHQFAAEGISPDVVYTCKSSQHIWTKEDNRQRK